MAKAAPKRKTSAKKAAAKSAPSKAVVKQAAAAKKAAAKKAAAKTATPAKAAPKQTAAKKAAAQKAAPKKAAAKKAAPAKAAARKAAPAKAAAAKRGAPKTATAKAVAKRPVGRPPGKKAAAKAVAKRPVGRPPGKKSAAKASTNKAVAKRPVGRPPGRKNAAPAHRLQTAAPTQSFAVSHLNEADFKADGLRTYAHYRDLGIATATGGLCQAHVIRMIAPCSDEVRQRHLHEPELQLVYVLKGWIKNEFEGHGEQMMSAGSCWLQPPGIEHTVLDYSADVELLEIIVPADFKTTDV